MSAAAPHLKTTVWQHQTSKIKNVRVQPEHQNGEERSLKCLSTWHGCWCQTDHFSTQPSLGLWSLEDGPQGRKIPVSGSGWKCLSEEISLGCFKSLNEHLLEARYACLNAQHIAPWSRRATAAQQVRWRLQEHLWPSSGSFRPQAEMCWPANKVVP